MQTNLQFSQTYFEGTNPVNGMPAYNDGSHIFTLGGFQNSSDSGGNAQFGALMSTSPSDPSGDGSFYMGIPSGYIIRGIVRYDAGVAGNDPAKPNYMLQGAPITLVYRGSLWYYSWDTSCVGAGAPNLSDVVIVQNSTGLLDFCAPGTTQAMVPTGWTVLSQTQARVKSYDSLLNAALVYFQL